MDFGWCFRCLLQKPVWSHVLNFDLSTAVTIAEESTHAKSTVANTLAKHLMMSAFFCWLATSIDVVGCVIERVSTRGRETAAGRRTTSGNLQPLPCCGGESFFFFFFFFIFFVLFFYSILFFLLYYQYLLYYRSSPRRIIFSHYIILFSLFAIIIIIGDYITMPSYHRNLGSRDAHHILTVLAHLSITRALLVASPLCDRIARTG